ncbi:hypothetical protein L2744_02340 [Shewanella profunda]|uniref:hypothetical protein n=1 Tax=Shewanella profunda TaxID=254793 RepID=UPI002010AB0E|nr:hypothetical protein [Shewanella profunda]MCL1088467.1 hypothetical protein [Shewanella profunda]
MSMFVKLTIAATVIVLGILAAGIYRFNMTNDDVFMVVEDGRVMPYDDAMTLENAKVQANAVVTDETDVSVPAEVKPVANASEVMLKLFTLNTANPFEVTLPEGHRSVVLTHFIKIKQTELAIGDYQDGEVKGRVLLDYMRITPLNFDPALGPDTQSNAPIQQNLDAQTMPFVAPFIVTTQGSGVFWYLGLFNLDYEHTSLKHLGSVLIGDRIEIDSVEPVYPFEPPYKIAVTYRDRAPNEPMSQNPEIVRILELTVSETSIN